MPRAAVTPTDDEAARDGYRRGQRDRRARQAGRT